MAGQPQMLVLRALKLGDLLVAVPALHALGRAFPEHRLRLAAPAWLAPIVELIGGVELLDMAGLEVPVPLEPGIVDVAVNLHGAGPQSHERLDALAPRRRIGYLCRAAGSSWDGPAWVEQMHERERWTSLLGWYGIEANPLEVDLDVPASPVVPGAVVVHPGAGSASRLWPVGHFGQVAGALARAGHRVVITGDAAERPRALEVARLAGLPPGEVLAGRLDLSALAGLVAGSVLVVSADTGVAHLASAYRRPSVVLFGPAPASRWGPPPGPHRVLTDESQRRGEVDSPEPDPALVAVRPSQVLAAVAELGIGVL